jgi:hypothetical protein
VRVVEPFVGAEFALCSWRDRLVHYFSPSATAYAALHSALFR